MDQFLASHSALAQFLAGAGDSVSVEVAKEVLQQHGWDVTRALEAFTGDSSTASLDYEKLSVRELKQRLAAAGVSSTGAVEVSDLVELLRQHDAEQASHRAPP